MAETCEPSDASSRSPTSTPPVLPSVTAQRYSKRPFTDAGRIFGKGRTPYLITLENEVDSTNCTYPFADLEEWKLAYWLSTSGLSQTNINNFLRLDCVSILSIPLILLI